MKAGPYRSADAATAAGTPGGALGANAQAIDPEPWLNAHGAANLSTPDTGGMAGCDPTTRAAPGAPPAQFEGGDPRPARGRPHQQRADHRPTLHLYQQTIAAFPDTSWACHSPRPGTVSEHPLGRACDGTFGNAIGQPPTPAQLELGWAVTNWRKTDAETLGVEYLIWQGKIWSLAREAEGWRPYDGGGMHNPSDVTGGHYDHLHVTVVSS